MYANPWLLCNERWKFECRHKFWHIVMNADIHSCIVLVRSMKLAKIHSNVYLSSMNYLIVSNSHA